MPYRGSSPAMQDSIANWFSLMFDAAPVVAPFLQAHQMRGVLATGATPSRAFSAVQTATAQGIANFTFNAGIGLFAAAGTPPEIISRLNAALNTAMADPVTTERVTGRSDKLRDATPDKPKDDGNDRSPIEGRDCARQQYPRQRLIGAIGADRRIRPPPYDFTPAASRTPPGW